MSQRDTLEIRKGRYIVFSVERPRDATTCLRDAPSGVRDAQTAQNPTKMTRDALSGTL